MSKKLTTKQTVQGIADSGYDQEQNFISIKDLEPIYPKGGWSQEFEDGVFPDTGMKKRGYRPIDWSVISSPSGESVASPEPVAVAVSEPVHDSSGVMVDSMRDVSFIPTLDSTYIQWGHHPKLEQIVKSEMFYPTFITGLSGNGKTLMVEQICAKLKRECIRVNITIETDEDDLLGGFRLVDGETVFHRGPVVDAMERGAVLLLDEIDLASNKILCLQPVLEGNGVFLKKTNEWVRPAKGFTILATANTKGKGSESGSFVGTQILNEAFLERFAVTFEQGYASAVQEKKMLLKHMAEADAIDDQFATKLSNWAESIRKTYYADGCDEIISTRRLVHIVKAFGIFGDKMTAIDLCISRFDEETKTVFMELYTVHDETIPVDGEVFDEATTDEPIPF